MNDRLLQQFVSEARELLETTSAALLQLESSPDDSEVMGTLFRAVHTLKGNSGLFEFTELTRVLHAAEDLMDAVRSGRIAFSAAMADRLLEATDFVTTLVDAIDADGAIGSASATESAALASALRALLAGGATVPADDAERAAAAIVPAESLPDAARTAAAAALAAGNAVTQITYLPDRECFFQGTDPVHLAMQVPDVVWAHIDLREPVSDLASMDAYACLLRLELLSTASREALEEHFRYEIDAAEFRTVVPADRAVTAGDPRVARGVEHLRTQRAILALPDDAAWSAGRLEAVRATCRAVAVSLGCTRDVAAFDTLEDTVAALDGWIERTLGTLEPVRAGAAVPVADAAAADLGERRVGGRRAEDQAAHKSLRVDHETIDRLMNLIGEMVVARNALPYLATRAEAVHGSREMAREIKAQYAIMSRITDAMQDAIMQVRMMPVATVFQRFPRLVRDISRQLGKEVALVVEGEDTAADKTVIEAIGDPMIHILRNSLDHGLETPDERRAAGKPAAGTLRIVARQESDRIVIEVHDDGRGIDPERIRRKAIERGLVDAGAAARLSDADAVNLVFAPGFSTAEVISDLSGRGVGMDVVRTAIERVNGTVTLRSVLGAGTTITLALPLSMAMTSVIVVECDGQRFGVPMDRVVETVRVPRSQVRPLRHRQAATLRGEVVPLVPITEALQLDAPPRVNTHDELAVLVTRGAEHTVGLLVDDFREAVDVIVKPLGGVLGGLTAYAGSALMGDGSVLMVLNPTEIC